MTRISSIRVLIALTSVHNLVIHHMDVKTAFLNGELEKKFIWIHLKGVWFQEMRKKVCRLVK